MSNFLLGLGAAILTALLFVCAADWIEELVGGFDFDKDEEE